MEFLTTLLNGLSLGGIYAMVALGYTMVYGIAKMLNFAHGDIIMVGAYTVVTFLSIRVHPIFAVLIAAVFCAVLAVLMEKLAYKPLRGASPLAVLITAIGVSYLLQSLALIIFGTGDKHAQMSSLGMLTIGELSIKYETIIILLCSAVLMVALNLFVKFTRTGRAMIAVSEDKGAAQLMGINVNFIITITFAIGAALAALAGMFKLMNCEAATPVFGSLPGIIAFTAAVVGGIGSIPGAMVGGLMLGVIECFSLSIPALANYSNAIQFAILIIILLVKPTGLLGKKRREKV